ncbi:MAG: flagellar export chaperone FliS [Betaproteobacteria bacterium]|nr:flagellar export chaperone FliS [Betaproteobacteria bacterium]NBT06345.1 flagellar export chaperone FliS [Betaproteobacteria bacterium]NBT82876.1 flagellar export chaperone FliS [Betaproteobacteria bacterium]NCY08495.1 flagellar export chaperone FliS [Betaproteobacteria bacterium]NDC86809.1 flagellar export chaperone FliS [Betaproteobacteria bacterium]
MVRGLRAYQEVDRQTAVLSANSIDLILLIYEALLRRLKQAAEAFLSKDVAARGESLSRALEVIDKGLIGSLDMQQGGQLSQQLLSQYQLWTAQVLHCNMKSDAVLLGELINQVEVVRSAWQQVKDESRLRAH